MVDRAGGNAGDDDSSCTRMGKRALSEQESGVAYLLNAAKKAHSEVASHSEQERPDDTDLSEKYIGVRWSKKKAKWRVRIKANGKDNHVGFFSDILSAAAAYDKAVLRFFPGAVIDRSFRLNFPDAVAAESMASSVNQAKADVGGNFGSSKDPETEKEVGSNPLPAQSSANFCVDQTRSKLHYTSAFSGSFSSSPRGRVLPSFIQQPSTTALSLPVPLPPLNLAPMVVSRPPQPSSATGTKHSVHLTPLAPITSRNSGEKSSIAHLLDDKSILEKISPSDSPLDESAVTPSNISVTPSNHSLGGYSAISTPSTMPSPSLMLSPTAGCPNSSRSQSTSRPCPPFSDTPPIFANHFAPPRMCPDPKGFLGPASFTAHPPALLQPLMSYASSFTPQGSDSQQNEIEAMKGLVKLGDGAADGPKTRRIRNHDFKADGRSDKAVFRLREDEATQMPLSSMLDSQQGSPLAGSRWTSGRLSGSQSFGLARMGEASRIGVKSSLESVLEHVSDATAPEAGRFATGKAEAERSCAPEMPQISAAAVVRRPKPPSKGSPVPTAASTVEGAGNDGRSGNNARPGCKTQSFRGVTWDKVKQMWRVRLCLAGGGREHVGYFANEEAGALAYARALERLKQKQGALPARALERLSQEREGRVPSSVSTGLASVPASAAGT